MKSTRNMERFLLLSSILGLLLAACGSTAGELPEADAGAETELPGNEGGPAEGAEGESDTDLTIGGTDPCSMFTTEQVTAAFGLEVSSVEAQEESLGKGCEFALTRENTSLSAIFYEGEAARYYFASLALAAENGCQALVETLFNATAPGEDEERDADAEALAASPMGDLYRAYLTALSQCMYVHWEERPDLGEQVVTSEVIFFDWSGNVAIIEEGRVLEVTYLAPVPGDIQNALDNAPDRDSYYELATPFRNQILVGFTERVISLLQAAQ